MIDPNPIFDGLRKYVSRFFRVNLGAARFAANYFDSDIFHASF